MAEARKAVVVISASGSVLGGTAGIREELPRPPELDTPPPEPPPDEDYSMEARERPDMTGYIKDADGNWSLTPEAVAALKQEIAESMADPKYQTPQRPSFRAASLPHHRSCGTSSPPPDPRAVGHRQPGPPRQLPQRDASSCHPLSGSQPLLRGGPHRLDAGRPERRRPARA